jgi:hypothetical protein
VQVQGEIKKNLLKKYTSSKWGIEIPFCQSWWWSEFQLELKICFDYCENYSTIISNYVEKVLKFMHWTHLANQVSRKFAHFGNKQHLGLKKSWWKKDWYFKNNFIQHKSNVNCSMTFRV